MSVRQKLILYTFRCGAVIPQKPPYNITLIFRGLVSAAKLVNQGCDIPVCFIAIRYKAFNIRNRFWTSSIAFDICTNRFSVDLQITGVYGQYSPVIHQGGFCIAVIGKAGHIADVSIHIFRMQCISAFSPNPRLRSYSRPDS